MYTVPEAIVLPVGGGCGGPGSIISVAETKWTGAIRYVSGGVARDSWVGEVAGGTGAVSGGRGLCGTYPDVADAQWSASY